MCQKNLRKIVDVHQICLYNLPKFQFVTLFIADLSFLFLIAHFEFVAEIFGGSTNISCQHTHFLVDFFETFKIVFFET